MQKEGILKLLNQLPFSGNVEFTFRNNLVQFSKGQNSLFPNLESTQLIAYPQHKSGTGVHSLRLRYEVSIDTLDGEIKRYAVDGFNYEILEFVKDTKKIEDFIIELIKEILHNPLQVKLTS